MITVNKDYHKLRKKIVPNSTAITRHKNAANVTPQHKHTEKH